MLGNGVALTLVLAMLCCTALATEETTGLPEKFADGPIPLYEQLEEVCSELDDDYEKLYDGTFTIADDWYVFLAEHTSYDLLVEPEGVMACKFSIHEDGTADLIDNGGTYSAIVNVNVSEDGSALFLDFYEQETGEDIASVQLLPYDVYGWSDKPTMIFFTSSYYYMFNNLTNGDVRLPSEEEQLAPVVMDVTAEDILAIGDEWELSYGITNRGNVVVPGELVGNCMNTGEGTTLSVFAREGGSCGFILSEGELCVAPYEPCFSEVERTEDGGIYVNQTMYINGYEKVLEATFYLYEDGRLGMHYYNTTYVFEKYTIDPLTEYSDKETVQLVQEAMNAEGFECGTADGIAGKKTASAISGFQAANGLTETGTVTYELLECLRAKGYDL